MSADFLSLQAASLSVLAEVQKQTDTLAKQLQQVAPPSEQKSGSVLYLIDTVTQLRRHKKISKV